MPRFVLLAFVAALTVSGAARASDNDPVCGNGVVERGEECDDGNLRAHDGCDPECHIEHILCRRGIAEPDDTCDVEGGDDCTTTCEIEPSGQVKTTVLPL